MSALLAIFIAFFALSCGGVNVDRVSVSQDALAAVLQINCGGDAVGPFVADQFVTGGATYSAGSAVETSGAANAAPPSVYQSERYGNFDYLLGGFTPGTGYTVRLHFAEIYWNAPGQRVFNVKINGAQVLTNLDIFAEVGRNQALVREFSAVSNASGQILVQYSSVVDSAKSSAIEVLYAGSANQAPTVASAASATLSQTEMTAALNARGDDDGGEGSLLYTWSALGSPPAPVSFSANGSNASKAVTATFTAAGNYTLRVTIQDQSGLTVTSDVGVSVVAAASPPAQPAGTAVYRINCGGSAVAPFATDQFYSGGTSYSTSSAVSTSGVSNAAPVAVYQTERYGNHSYTFAGLTANASYVARLHFAEIHWTASGKRVFNVAVNGQQVITNFDIFASCGGNKACLRDISAKAGADGRLSIEFRSVVDNAKSSGIEILSTSASGAPTVASAAVATTNPVSGRSTALSVSGADDGGEARLVYSWATGGTPPAAVSFSVNDSNAAKQTTATFSKAGTYTLVATIRDEGGQTVTSSVNVTVRQTFSGLEVSPASVSLTQGSTKQFTVIGKDQFGNAMTAPATTWSTNGGTIDSTGLFTATAKGQFTIVASSSSTSSTAAVTVTDAGSNPQPSDTELVVSWGATRQTIEGFGAADPQFADFSSYDGAFTDSIADTLFSTDRGIGLSLLRVGITPQGTNWAAWSNATKAAARGAKVWATPWSAPAAMKDNGSVTNGGHLLPNRYADWADSLLSFRQLLKQKSGVDLYALSAQNEPDLSAGYESMLFSNSEMVNFVKVLGPKLAAVSPRPKLIVGNYSNWDNLSPLVAALESDATAMSYVDFYGSNQYYGTPDPETGARPVWEMEWSTFDGFDPGVGNGLNMARKVHDALTIANVAAWHYWWCRLQLDGQDNQALFGPGDAPSKRLWMLGNWSKFVRPGFVRITTQGGPSGVYVSAFRDPVTKAFTVVAINSNSSAKTLGINFVGASPGSVVPWRTSSTEDLSRLTTLSPSGSRLSVTLAASSVTSFTGTGN